MTACTRLNISITTKETQKCKNVAIEYLDHIHVTYTVVTRIIDTFGKYEQRSL